MPRVSFQIELKTITLSGDLASLPGRMQIRSYTYSQKIPSYEIMTLLTEQVDDGRTTVPWCN